MHKSRVNEAVFSRDSKIIATAGADCIARLWDVPTGRPPTGPLQHKTQISWMSMTGDGGILATVLDGASARDGLWEISGDRVRGRAIEFRLKGESSRQEKFGFAAFDPSGRRLALGGHKHLSYKYGPSSSWWFLIDVATMAPILPIMMTRNYVQDIVFSPDGSRVATVCGSAHGGPTYAIVWYVGPN